MPAAISVPFEPVRAGAADEDVRLVIHGVTWGRYVVIRELLEGHPGLRMFYLEGTLEIMIGSEAPVAAKSGQAFFLKRGTQHGFKNIGTTPGAAIEIFVKQTTTAGGSDPVAVLAMELAALRAGAVQK